MNDSNEDQRHQPFDWREIVHFDGGGGAVNFGDYQPQTLEDDQMGLQWIYLG